MPTAKVATILNWSIKLSLVQKSAIIRFQTKICQLVEAKKPELCLKIKKNLLYYFSRKFTNVIKSSKDQRLGLNYKLENSGKQCWVKNE